MSTEHPEITLPQEEPPAPPPQFPRHEVHQLPVQELQRRALLLLLYAGRRALVLLMILGVLAVLGLMIGLLKEIQLVASITAIATLLAYVLAPAVNYLHGVRKINRILAISLVYVAVGLLLVVSTAVVMPVVREQFLTLTHNFSHFVANLQANLKAYVASLQQNAPGFLKPALENIDVETFTLDSVSFDLQSSLPKILGGTFSGVFSGVKAAAGMVTGTMLVPLFTFYILMDSQRYHDAFLRLWPGRWKKDVMELMTEINNVLGRYIRGQLIVCVTIGTSIAILLNYMKLEYATLIGVFAGVVDIIPYVGVAIGYVPAVLIAWVNHGLLWALVVLGAMAIVHWLEGHIIVPAVIGHSVGLPPLLVMVALGAGAELGGIMGMVLAIPMAAILRVLCLFYVRKLEESEKDEPAPNTHSNP